MVRLVDLVFTDGVASCMRYDGHRRTTALHVGGAVVHVGCSVVHVDGAVVHVGGVGWIVSRLLLQKNLAIKVTHGIGPK